MASNKKSTTVGKPAAAQPAAVAKPAVAAAVKPAAAKVGGKKLDFNRPYGTVFGEHKAAYEQDGVLYDANGNQIGGKAPVVEAEVPAAETGGGDAGGGTGEGVGAELNEDELAKLGSGE